MTASQEPHREHFPSLSPPASLPLLLCCRYPRGCRQSSAQGRHRERSHGGNKLPVCLMLHSSDLWHSGHSVSHPCHPTTDGGFHGTRGSCSSLGTAWPRTPWDTPLQTYRVQVVPQMSWQCSICSWGWDKEDWQNGSRERKQRALDKKRKEAAGRKKLKEHKGRKKKSRV